MYDAKDTQSAVDLERLHPPNDLKVLFNLSHDPFRKTSTKRK